jgi:N6-L-threonylcarbamoyladenine synthase
MNKIKILGVETSCDETALALVEAGGGLRSPRFKILKNLVASQIKIHRPFGGVVPSLAKREHIRNLPILFKKLPANFSKSKIPRHEAGKNQNAKLQSKNKNLLLSTFYFLNSIDLIAVTVGPGLEPALWTGIEFAKKLLTTYHLPPSKLIGVNHLEGHLFSFLLSEKNEFSSHNFQFSKIFPAVALIVSGGHTVLLKMDSLTRWRRLGETRDDAAGEAFDKVARLLGLPYPGGPEVEKLARRGNPDAINFPRPMIHDKSYDFSFSGLKTAVLYYLRDHRGQGSRVKSQESGVKSQESRVRSQEDIAASFQQAVIDVLVSKTIRAAKEYGAKSVILSGGVAANKLLRKTLKGAVEKLNSHGRIRIAGARGRRRAVRMQFFVPDFKYNLDNAAMIAVAGYITRLRQGSCLRRGFGRQVGGQARLRQGSCLRRGFGRQVGGQARLRQGSGGQAHLRKKKHHLIANGNLNI